MSGGITAYSVVCPTFGGGGGIVAALSNPMTALAALALSLGCITAQINTKEHQKNLTEQRSQIRNLNNQIKQLKKQAQVLSSASGVTLSNIQTPTELYQGNRTRLPNISGKAHASFQTDPPHSKVGVFCR